MAAYNLSNFHEALRTLLGDEGDSAAGYDYPDEQLDGALRTAVRMGAVRGMALVDGVNPTQLVEPPGNADTWGYLVAWTARSLIAGSVQESIRTRAVSWLVDPASRRDAVTFLDTLISDLDARGNVGGTADDTSHKGLFGTEGDVMTRIGFCLQSPPPWNCCP